MINKRMQAINSNMDFIAKTLFNILSGNSEGKHLENDIKFIYQEGGVTIFHKTREIIFKVDGQKYKIKLTRDMS